MNALITDFYGMRMATCSSDLKINVFDYNGETQSWIPNASWKAHDAAVLRVVPTVTLLTTGELGTSKARPNYRVLLTRSNCQNLAGTVEWYVQSIILC